MFPSIHQPKVSYISLIITQSYFNLIICTHLEPCGTPVDKVDCLLVFNDGNGSVDIFGSNVTTVEEAARHVLPSFRITSDQLIGRVKAGGCDIVDGEMLVERLASRQQGGVGGKREVDARVWHEVCLELVHVNVQCTVKA